MRYDEPKDSGRAGRERRHARRGSATVVLVILALLVSSAPATAGKKKPPKQVLWEEIVHESAASQMAGRIRVELEVGPGDDRVTVRAIPGIRVTAGTYFRWTGSIMAMVVTLPFAWMCGDPLPIDPGSTAYRFKRDLSHLDLLLDGEIVKPLDVDRVCKPRYQVPYGRKTKEKKVRGCYEVHQYPLELFVPGAPLSVRIYEGRKPAREGDVPLEPALLESVRRDG